MIKRGKKQKQNSHSKKGKTMTGNYNHSLLNWEFPVKSMDNYLVWISLILPLAYCSQYIHMDIYMKSVQFSCSVLSDSLQPHGLQHTRLPCPSPTPRACSNSCPSSWWCHQIISSSVVPVSSCLQSFPASGSFPMSQFFSSGGQSTGVSASASVLPMSIQDWFPLRLTGWISLQSKGLSRVFSFDCVMYTPV